MKITHVITRGHLFYGAQKHVLDLSRCLLEDGHEASVICGSEGPLTEKLDRVGVPVAIVPVMQNPLNMKRDSAAVLGVYKELKKRRPDVVATHSAKAGVVGRVAARMARVPSVFTAHGWSFANGVPEKQRRMALYTERFCGMLSSRVIAVAMSETEYAIECGVLPREKLATVYYGVEDLAGEAIERTKDASAEIELVMVAGFRAQKDHSTLLKALSAVKELPWRMTLLGDGELEDAVRKQARDLGLEDRVHFAGAVNDVSGYLRKSDVMLLVTNWEGMPISTIEGLSFSLPVIATDVAGTREQVIDGVNGRLVPRGDSDSVANAIQELIGDAELRKSFGNESRALYENNFTIDTMYRNTLSVYESVVDR